MNNNEEFVRPWSEITNSLANSETTHSGLRRVNTEDDRDNVGRKRPAKSRIEGKRNRAKKQTKSQSSDISHNNLSEKKRQRDLIRSKLEILQELTPNCPKSDIISILDCVIEYMRTLQFFLQYYRIPYGKYDD